MSSDPYRELPNLTGEAGKIEEIRSGDPSRYFPSPRGGNVDAVSGRILDMPRASVRYAAGNAAYGGGASFLPFDTIDYDTDRLTRVIPEAGGTFLTCTTPGLYLALAEADMNGVAGGAVGVWLRLANRANTISYGQTTDLPTPTAWGSFIEATGFWLARPGDEIGVRLETTLTVNLQANASLKVCMISSIGSDNP